MVRQLHRSSFIRQRVVMVEPQPMRAGDRVHRHQQLLRVGFLSHLRSVRATMSQKSSVPVVGNAVPNPIRLRRLVFDGFRPTRSEPVIPAIECRRLDPEHLQRSPAGRCDCSTRPMISSFSDAGSLMFGLPHHRSCLWNGAPLLSAGDIVSVDNRFGGNRSCKSRFSGLIWARTAAASSGWMPVEPLCCGDASVVRELSSLRQN